MRLRAWAALMTVVPGLMLVAPGEVSAQKRETPYYASIAAGKARMRTGPGRNYPAIWLYIREDLPIKVVDIYHDWRKVEDPDGTQGWMQVGLLSAARTAMVREGVTELRASPDFSGRVLWRAEQGVIGTISKCAEGWCYFEIERKGGYVAQSELWGVDPGEQF